MNKKVVLAGGSGFLGMSLAKYLKERDYEVVILSRGQNGIKNDIRYVHWDGITLSDWFQEIEGSYGVVNFTGKSVDCIYTPANKEEILSSRLDSVHILHKAISSCANPPEVFVQAGSLAIFGNTTNVCYEGSEQGSGFSVEVCQKWEEAFFQVKHDFTRQVMLRIGFALDRNGGALLPLENLTIKNLGGTVGSGKQYISWIHIEDLNKMFLKALEDEKTKGIYNATGPSPVTNKLFMSSLRNHLGKKWSVPTPTPFVWLGAYLVMKADPSLALTGRNCLPKKFLDEDFTFTFQTLEEAFDDLYKKQ